MFAGAFAGAVLLFVAEFTTLYHQQIATYHAPTTNVGTGPHDSYALIPIALLALILAFAVLRGGSRAALLAIGIAGLVALLIALVGDLPDTHLNEAVLSPNGNYVSAKTSAGPGMYLETLGAILLIATSGCGFLMLWRPPSLRGLGGGGDEGGSQTGGERRARPGGAEAEA